MENVARETKKRTFELDADVLAALDQWQARTRQQKNLAVEVGLWLVMQMSAGELEAVILEMDAREDAVQDLERLRGSREIPTRGELRDLLVDLRDRLDRLDQVEASD